jgi:hypothetical protein
LFHGLCSFVRSFVRRSFDGHHDFAWSSPAMSCPGLASLAKYSLARQATLPYLTASRRCRHFLPAQVFPASTALASTTTFIVHVFVALRCAVLTEACD